tara:strand:- start:118 stop:783 length:666 start_codon:yes stop_codon:yes gene_type:complete
MGAANDNGATASLVIPMNWRGIFQNFGNTCGITQKEAKALADCLKGKSGSTGVCFYIESLIEENIGQPNLQGQVWTFKTGAKTASAKQVVSYLDDEATEEALRRMYGEVRNLMPVQDAHDKETAVGRFFQHQSAFGAPTRELAKANREYTDLEYGDERYAIGPEAFEREREKATAPLIEHHERGIRLTEERERQAAANEFAALPVSEINYNFNDAPLQKTG